MKLKYLGIAAACCFIAMVTLRFAAQDNQTRSITSDDFASQRPVAKAAAGNKGHSAGAKRVTYKYVRRDATAVRWRSGRKNPPRVAVIPKGPAKVSDIGVTMWKLRPSGASDSGYKLPVRINGEREMWTAER